MSVPIKVATNSISNTYFLNRTEVSAHLKESFKTLQNEKAAADANLKAVRDHFTVEVDKLHSSLKLSDQRYRTLESKSLLDVDREKLLAAKLESENKSLRKSLLNEQSASKEQLIKHQKIVNEFRENIGLLKGQLKESQRQQIASENKLKQALSKIQINSKSKSAVHIHET